MYTGTLFAVFSSLLTVAHSLPALSLSSSPLPLIIWHGLGDRFDADGINQTAEYAALVNPGTFVYPIRVDDDGSKDQRATFFGNLSAQIDQVCATLSANPTLNADNTRIDALGFSQGGQFLRGLIERCGAISVRSLVTFGSQHSGIDQFQTCGTWDLVCKGAIAAVKGNAWSDFVQGNIVPAQYYREIDPDTGLGSEDYLEKSNFLADVNNERENKSAIYKQRLSALENFAMYVFEDDKTVLPKESGWFAEVNTTSLVVTPLRNRTMYKEDWLGLLALDDKDALHFRTAPGGHMELSKKILKEAFQDFFGVETKTKTSSLEATWRAQSVLALP